MACFSEQRLGSDATNLLQAETEVGAQKGEHAIKVHLVERDHQVIDTAVSKVIQCLLLAASQE